jgi:mannan endo-1,4-beta-mannosidase
MTNLYSGVRAAVIIFLAVLVTGSQPVTKADEFVKTSNTIFTLGGKPFYITGVNNHYVTYAMESEVLRVLNDSVTLGATTIRIFLQPVIGSLDDEVPSTWDWKRDVDSNSGGMHGAYLLYWNNTTGAMAVNEGPNGMQKIDYLIAEAKKRNLRLIINFLDFWNYTGGTKQMLSWYGATDENMFFIDPRLKRDYKDWVSYVLERVNPLTGLRYKDDPTIMAWELMNEPQTDPNQIRVAWVAEMSAFVKSIDHNHLVGSGGANQDVGTFSQLSNDLAIPTVDFGTWHGYPLWFNNITPKQFTDLIPQFCKQAALHQKPVLLEEFGYARSHPDQIDNYTKWLAALHNDHDCAGWLVWRLVSRQFNGDFPLDDHDQFDIRNDGGPLWNVLKAAMRPAAPVAPPVLVPALVPAPKKRSSS